MTLSRSLGWWLAGSWGWLSSPAESRARWRIMSWISVGSLLNGKGPLVFHKGGFSRSSLALALAFALVHGLCFALGIVVFLEMVLCQQMVGTFLRTRQSGYQDSFRVLTDLPDSNTASFGIHFTCSFISCQGCAGTTVVARELQAMGEPGVPGYLSRCQDARPKRILEFQLLKALSRLALGLCYG